MDPTCMEKPNGKPHCSCRWLLPTNQNPEDLSETVPNSPPLPPDSSNAWSLSHFLQISHNKFSKLAEKMEIFCVLLYESIDKRQNEKEEIECSFSSLIMTHGSPYETKGRRRIKDEGPKGILDKQQIFT